MSEPAVLCVGVQKSFGAGETRVPVLRDVALRVEAGEVTFLVGPSGCGKTTLLTAVAGMLTLDGGAVSVFGTAIERLRGARLARFRGTAIGFIFQQFNLLPALTAAENAAIPLLVQGMRAPEAEARASALLDRLGLGAHVRKFPSQLSGGQQQRVAIARAMVHAPRLIVCDEPTAALDAAAGRAVMALLREMALQPDRAVLVVTHDDRILGFADRVAHMQDGRITDISGRAPIEATDAPAAAELV